MKKQTLLEVNNDGNIPRRQSKFLKMLQNYTAKSPQQFLKREVSEPEQRLIEAKKALKDMSSNISSRYKDLVTKKIVNTINKEDKTNGNLILLLC